MLIDTLRRYFPAFAAALATTALLAAACGDSGDHAPPDRNPDIRGEITEISPGSPGVLGTLLVEGEIEPDTQYDRASVRVDEDTEIFQMTEGQPGKVGFFNFAVGYIVEVWFEGPVAESYPVQGTAGAILTIDPIVIPVD